MSEHRWNRLTAPELRELAAQDALVLLPVDSTEQHGAHLPTGVDDFLATEVCHRAAALVGDHAPVVVAPPVWCGLAEHHMSFVARNAHTATAAKGEAILAGCARALADLVVTFPQG